MRKSFKMEDLECAHCAAKMEADISKLEGVNSASISFMTAKLVLDAQDDLFDQILDQAQAICRKYEPDCTILR